MSPANSGPVLPGALTRRQREILVLRAQGLDHDDIADRLFISTRTIVRESARAAKELGASNLIALGAIAYAYGILSDEHLVGADGSTDAN